MRYTTPINTLAVNSSGERQLEAHHLDDNFAAQDNAIGAITRALFAVGGVAKAGTVTLTGLNLRVQDRVGVTLDTSAALHVTDLTLDLTTLPAGKGTVVMTTDPVTVNRTYTDIVTQESLTDTMTVRLGRLYVMGAGEAGVTLDAQGYPVAPQNTVPVAHVTRTAGGATLDEVLNPDIQVNSSVTGPAGADGVSVTAAEINGSGHLIITLSTGATIDAGVAKGADGAQGAKGDTGAAGRGIATVGQSGGHLTGTYSDGSAWDAGVLPAGTGGALPSGGTAGQVLTKQSGADGDATWQTPTAGGGGGGVLVSATAPSSPAQGQQWYDTSRNYLLTYVSTAWRDAMGTDRTPASPGAFSWYRLNITDSRTTVYGYSDKLALREFALQGSAGGPQLAVGGAPSSIPAGQGVQYAFDGANEANTWQVDSKTALLSYHLPAPTLVTHYTLICEWLEFAPRSWVLEGSNDGVTWVPLHTVAESGAWAAGGSKSYAI